MTKENNSKLADFGISKIVDKHNFLTPCMGTDHYMSPEIKAGNDYDYKTDVWYAKIKMRYSFLK